MYFKRRFFFSQNFSQSERKIIISWISNSK